MRGTTEVSRRRLGFLTTSKLIDSLFLVAVVFLVSAFLLVLAKPRQAAFSTTQRRMTVDGATLLQNYTIDYPVFHDQKVDGVVSQYISSQVNRFESGMARRYDMRNRLEIAYAFLHRGERLASFSFTTKTRQIGRPDTTTRRYFIFDLAEKREITAKDLLVQDDTARQLLAQLLHDYFKHQPSLRLSDAELVGLLELPLAALKQMYVTADSMVMEVNPHNPAAEDGRVRVALDKSLLAGIVPAAYLSDKNTARVAELPVQFAVATRPPAGDTIDPSGKMLALTFDDGPSAMTNQLLSQLQTYEGHATFFVLGYAVDGHRGELQRTLQQGSEVGNHSWGHADLQLQSPGGLDHQVQDTEQAIQRVTGGYAPRLMRPPYGSTNSTVHDYLQSHGFTQALWNVDTRDWLDKNAEVVYQRIMAGAHDGAVILLHDIHPTSVEAAVRAIRDLKAQGYQLVTLSRLYQYR